MLGADAHADADADEVFGRAALYVLICVQEQPRVLDLFFFIVVFSSRGG